MSLLMLAAKALASELRHAREKLRERLEVAVAKRAPVPPLSATVAAQVASSKGWWNTPDECLDCKVPLDADRQIATKGNYPTCEGCAEKRVEKSKALRGPRKARAVLSNTTEEKG